MNSFDPADYIPQVSGWFSPSIEYVGLGTAKFLNPKGYITGITTVKYSEQGETSIHMEPELLTLEDHPERTFSVIDIMVFLSGKILAETPFGKAFTYNFSNPCSSIKVETSEGIFVADKVENYQPNGLFGEIIEFSVLKAEFRTANSAPAKYFVMPLYNFLSNEFTWHHEELLRHPLRIHKAPFIEAVLDAQQTYIANYNIRSKLFICFEHKGKPAFIDKLSDYENLREQLENKTKQLLITSVLVGELAAKRVDLINWEEIIPSYLTYVLSLSSGSMVTTSWIEIRDDEGKLINRIHTNRSTRKYKKGIACVDSFVKNGGIAQLLEQAQTSDYLNTYYFRAVIDQIIMAGYLNDDSNIEDKLSHLFRGLDAICEKLGSKKKLKPEQYLTPENKIRFKSLYAKFIQDLEAIIPNNDDEESSLKGVIQQFHKAKVIELGLGKATLELLKRFNFPDGEILNAFYMAKTGSNRRYEWANLITTRRGKVIHEAWFDWDNNPPETKELISLFYHLHDVMVRILLKSLNYDGEYIPSIFKLRGRSHPIDWVKPDTLAKQLGYE